MTIAPTLDATTFFGMLGASLGELAFAVGIVVAGPARFRLPLALLGLDLFAWSFAAFGFTVTGRPEFRWLDLMASPPTAAILLDFVARFVGRERPMRPYRIASAVGLSALALSSVVAWVVPSTRGFPASPAWCIAHLLLLLPSLGLAVALLLQHRARVHNDELGRTQLLLAAIGLGLALGMSELWNGVTFPLPLIGHLGMLAGSGLLLAVAARRPGPAWSIDVTAFSLLAVFGVSAYLAVFRVFGDDSALRLLAIGGVTLALISLSRRGIARAIERRERFDRLATVARFSAQLAHDLKNPLAALKGATQFLEGELAHGKELATQANFLKLIGDQVERLTRVVDHYERLGRVEPVRAVEELNAVVRQVLALGRFAQPEVQLREELASEALPCAIDRDLVGNALENLLRNAAEAMPEGGTITVRTERLDDALVLSVHDTGKGMDRKVQARAFDDFFTTKAKGSGLGLAFVRRVAEAHGGSVSLQSRSGEGTRVRIELPLGERA
jgi:two-component system sensor histidine kinase HydH